MALTHVADLVRRAARDTGVFDALRNNPERLRAPFDLSAQHLDALHGAAALPLPAITMNAKPGLKARVGAASANRNASSVVVQDDTVLLPPEGSGQFAGVAGPIVPGAPRVPIASPTANAPQSRLPPSPVAPPRLPPVSRVPVSPPVLVVAPRPPPANPPVPSMAPRKIPPSPGPPIVPVQPLPVAPVPVRAPIMLPSPVYAPIGPPTVTMPIQNPAPLRSSPPTPCGPPQPPAVPAPTYSAFSAPHLQNGCCCATVALASIVSTTALSAVTAITAIVGMTGRVR